VIQVAFVNQYGEIEQACSPANDFLYENNVVQLNGLISVHVAHDLDIHEFAKTHVYLNGEWVERNSQPSLYHYWKEGEWIYDSERFLNELKGFRNQKLLNSDWTQIPDNGLTESQREQWRVYRQALRDLPEINEATLLEDVAWPIPPQ